MIAQIASTARTVVRSKQMEFDTRWSIAMKMQWCTITFRAMVSREKAHTLVVIEKYAQNHYDDGRNKDGPLNLKAKCFCVWLEIKTRSAKNTTIISNRFAHFDKNGLLLSYAFCGFVFVQTFWRNAFIKWLLVCSLRYGFSLLLLIPIPL